MPPRDWRARINDILEAMRRIVQYVTGITFARFEQNDEKVDAVLF